MVTLPIINTVSSSYSSPFNKRALHIGNDFLKELFKKIRGVLPFSQRTSWRRTCCVAVAGWRSSSGSPGRCPAATQPHHTVEAQSICLWTKHLMTYLLLLELQSSWNRSPGLRLQGDVKQAWSSDMSLSKKKHRKGDIRRHNDDTRIHTTQWLHGHLS